MNLLNACKLYQWNLNQIEFDETESCATTNE